MVKILFVATTLPIPVNSGQAIRTMGIIRGLAKSGHEVTFISFAKTESADLEPLTRLCSTVHLVSAITANLTLQTSYIRRMWSLGRLKPFSLERFYSRSMRERIQIELLKGRSDLIVSDGLYSLVNIPDTIIPIILNCHNIEHVIFARYALTETHMVKKIYAGMEARLIRRAERKAFHRVSAAMACSQVDIKLARELNPELDVALVPNVVDTDVIRPQQDRASDDGRPVLLFQGIMDWYPNRDAVAFFARTILPHIARQYSNVRFVIAGRNPPRDFVSGFSDIKNIEFTGTVPDIRPYLVAATVVIVPLRVGGGTRIKILEACAAGKAVVSTSIGAEGLDLKDNVEILIADNPAEFARRVLELLGDPKKCEKLGQHARSAVVDRFSVSILQERLDSFLYPFEIGRSGATDTD